MYIRTSNQKDETLPESSGIPVNSTNEAIAFIQGSRKKYVFLDIDNVLIKSTTEDMLAFLEKALSENPFTRDLKLASPGWGEEGYS